ncbi:hypothetical protein BLOT_002898 [Blomia tropicalis]|nr:hypothetical protein BLOT_002898 [Blomia tropicalis]
MYYYDRHVVHNGGVIENLEDQKTEKYEVKPYYMTAFALGAMRTLINIGNQLAPTLSTRTKFCVSTLQSENYTTVGVSTLANIRFGEYTLSPHLSSSNVIRFFTLFVLSMTMANANNKTVLEHFKNEF